MTMPVDEAVAGVAEKEHVGHIDWPAVFAGAFIASAISFVLMTFGSAVGLGFTSPFETTGMSVVGIAIAFTIWLVIVQVWSFMAGAYVTGRMRRRMFDATEHESDVRDGIHGLLVWATGVLIGGVLLAAAGSGVMSATTSAAGGVAQTTIDKIGDAVSDTNPLAYVVDQAFRGGSGAADAGGAAGNPREEATAIITRDLLEGEIPQEDRTYLAVLVAQDTGLSQEEAQARVDAMISNAQAAVDEAKEAADRAKNFAVVAAFITAASLALSAAAAWFAAGAGGRHRDEGTVLAVWFDRMR